MLTSIIHTFYTVILDYSSFNLPFINNKDQLKTILLNIGINTFNL
jgi:hypothetical protein